jgi:hypothetical protein
MAMQSVPAVFGADSVASQISALPPGSRIELRLKDKQRMWGTIGAVSTSGFTLVDTHAGEHQLAFDDVASVKRTGSKSHTRRNVLIVAGIGVAAATIAIVIYAKRCPLGCNSRSGF